MKRYVLAGVLVVVGSMSWGADATPRSTYHPPEVLTWSSGLQIVLSLVLVLGLMAGVVWLLKRFQGLGQPPSRGKAVMRVVSSLAVGQRERVVLVEVDQTWVMVGVAPGQIRALHVQQVPLSHDAPD